MKKKDILIGLASAFILALLLSPLASTSPDGLERVAEDEGFLKKGEIEPMVKSAMPDYMFPGVKSKEIATSISGMAGVGIVFIVTYSALAVLRKGKR